ncbi:transcriptional regulator [Halalkalibacter wakoensis JCM 9140]|uniref:Transcriptional regulator n=1 Tax=Halalkalibacter wakoensis JCM 9140 TaxID=1236970 RepID=W4Q0E0_9BACI|nr:TetR/AcrR family transcriptional regulator [Halalkalibacter wakoensis]GAE25541.1 transcriptional regulator [Halalkalibacter wakoensis JCM 9140]
MSEPNEQKDEENKRGRPLDLSRNEVILKATLDLLAECGYDALTIDAVAGRAKVGKATIYRRWSSKTELVIEANAFIWPFNKLNETINRDLGVREQLMDVISLIFQFDNYKHQSAMMAIHAATSSNEQLEKELKNDFYWLTKQAIESVVKPFLKEKSLTDAECDLLTDLAPALLTYRGIFIGKPFDRDYVEQIVDNMIMPIIQTALRSN